MIVLGLLLILIAVGASVVAAQATMVTSPVIELTAVNVTVMASPLAMFISGAASVALLGLGFALVQRGAQRKIRSRKEIRQLRRDNADNVAVVARTSTEAEGSSSRARIPDESTTNTTKAEPKDPTNNNSKESGTQGPLEQHPRSESSS